MLKRLMDKVRHNRPSIDDTLEVSQRERDYQQRVLEQNIVDLERLRIVDAFQSALNRTILGGRDER